MSDVSLSPGRLTALWLALRCLDQLGGTATPGELKTYASRSALRIGALPIQDGLRLAREGRMIQGSNEQYELSELGRAALRLGVEDEPSPEARRFFVSVLMLADPAPWVAYWQGDPSALDLIVPESERRTLRETGLLPRQPIENDLRSWAFWQALGRVPLVSETASQRKIIGDAGEKLSMEYERNRLREEGFPELGQLVEQVSQESDAYGFDLLSFAGRLGQAPDERLAIEVKASSLPRGESLHFFISAHEWEISTQLGNRYIIHVWTGVDPGPPAFSPESEPTTVRAAILRDHIPEAAVCLGRCRWQSAEIHLPAQD